MVATTLTGAGAHLALVLAGLGIWRSQKARAIPAHAAIHESVRTRVERTPYKPKNLLALGDQVVWVK